MRRTLFSLLGLSLAVRLTLLAVPSAAQAPATVRPVLAEEARNAPYRDDLPRGTGPDLDTLIAECQKSSTDPSRMTLVWWVPEDFWRLALQDNKDLTKGETDEFLAVMRLYTLMIVVDGKVGDGLKVRYQSEAQIRSELRMKGMDGATYKPLAADEVGPAPQAVVEVMKPMFKNLLGPMGENMRFFYFPARGKGDARLADAHATGQLSMFIGPREYRWRLPLSSVFARKKCPECSEQLSGDRFCPYDGTRLPVALPGGT